MRSKTDLPAPIGAVFTPLEYAQETIINCQLYEKWRSGAIILDPTAGSGNFIEAFIKTARTKNDPITPELLKNLYAVEMQSSFVKQFHENIKQIYNIDFPKENYIQGDYLFTNLEIEADYLIGNPPWLNFCDLEDHYKETIKHLFLETGLARNKKELLLGGSRIDIAALIISEAIRKNLKKDGNAFFYLPLSLFLNDGAHNGFRAAININNHFSLNYIYDYKDHPIFPDVSTRYGFASFTKNHSTNYPIDYLIMKGNGIWENHKASPIGESCSPLIIHKENNKIQLPRILIDKESKPRQGLNTCGANKLFIFDTMEIKSVDLCLVKNKEISTILPIDLVYPLIGAKQFRNNHESRFVFLPYNRNGKVLSQEELQEYTEAYDYLLKNKKSLCKRKGVLIRNSIEKGLWWSLLGIGPYSFSPWKIVWEAYGKKEFKAQLFSEHKGRLWQPNQALQAFIPVDNKKDALRLLEELQNPLIEELLKSQGMEGTCNWAQPGRMMKFFKIKNTD